MKIVSRNTLLKKCQKTMTYEDDESYIEYCGKDMTIGQFEKTCASEHDIIIDNITCRDRWHYIKKDGNWYKLK